MPSIRYMNQSAPFWDFVASLEQQGQEHPFFARQRSGPEEGPSSGDEQMSHPPPFGPWGFGPPGPWGPRGRGMHGRHHHQPPPTERQMPDAPGSHADEPSDPPPEAPREPGEGRRHHGCHGRRGGFGGRRGGWGGHWGRRHGGWENGPFGLGALAQFLGQENEGETRDGGAKDFEPEADVFDTESSFIVHISLPGAKKEDVGVNWDTEKSELSIAGVIYRPGDEDLLKTLALDERKVGPFERKIRLGTRANPATIDADMISAKLEDGILRVEVPKMEGGFVEVRKVDIE